MAGSPVFVVLKELQDFIIPLNPEEILHLEKSLRLEGCRDPLIIWQRKSDELVLVDGHHRYRICQVLDIPFTYQMRPFEDIEQVKIWMIENQIGRRNLTLDQVSYYRGLKYLSLKRKKGGFENIRAKGTAEHSTSAVLAKEFNVSASTIKRDSKFAAGLTIIAKIDSTFTNKILNGEVKLEKTRIQALSVATNPKATIERWLMGDFTRTKNRRPNLDSSASGDSIKNLRNRIVTTINKLLITLDTRDLAELRLLVDKLETELAKKTKTQACRIARNHCTNQKSA